MPLEAAVQGDAGAKNGMVRSHRFLGANTALPHLRGDAEQERRTLENLRGRASLSLLWSGPARVDALMRARGVGHRLPGGTMDSNEVWLEVTALDAAGKVIGVSGARGRDGALDGEAHLVRAQPVDGRGAPLTRRDPQHQRGVAFDAALTPVRPAGGALRGAARHGARAGAPALPQVHRGLRGVRLRGPAARTSAARCLDLPIARSPPPRLPRARRAPTIRRRWSTGGSRSPTPPPTTPRRRASRSRRRARSGRRASSRCSVWRGWRTGSGRPTTSSATRRGARRASPITRRRWRWRRARCSTRYRFAPGAPGRRTAGAPAARRSHRAGAGRARARAHRRRGGRAGRGRRPAGDRPRIGGGLLPARRSRSPSSAGATTRRRAARALRAVPRRRWRPTWPCATAGGAPSRPRRRIRAVPHPPAAARALAAPARSAGVRLIPEICLRADLAPVDPADATNARIAASTRASESACVVPLALRSAADTSSESLPPSTTSNVDGAVMRARTAASLSSGQSASRLPCTNRIGVRSASSTSSRIAPSRPTAADTRGR